MKQKNFNKDNILRALRLAKDTFGHATYCGILLKGTSISLEAKNTDTVLKITWEELDNTIEEEKRIVSNIASLHRFIENLGDFSIKRLASKWSLKIGDSKLTIPDCEYTAFDWDTLKEQEKTTFDKTTKLVGLIKSIDKFVGSNDPTLSLINLKKTEEGVSLIATDGFRVGYSEAKLECEKFEPINLPPKAIDILVLASPDAFDINTTENGLVVSIDGDINIKLFTSRLNKKYPDITNIFKNVPDEYIKFSGSDVLSILDLHRQIKLEKDNRKTTLRFKSKELTIDTTNINVETKIDHTESIKDISLDVSIKYLIDAIDFTHKNNDTASFFLGVNRTKRLLWVTNNDKDPDVYCLIAPIN